MKLVILPEGTIRTIYDETIDLAVLGVVEIARASHVEPESGGTWSADLGPVGGPVLGPFTCRSQALDAERDWLEATWLTRERLVSNRRTTNPQTFLKCQRPSNDRRALSRLAIFEGS